MLLNHGAAQSPAVHGGPGNLRRIVRTDSDPADLPPRDDGGADVHADSAPARLGTPKQKAAVIVAKRIVASVERQRLGPGDKLPPERIMQEEYGVGRSTLREALRFLELQGVLSLKTGPGGGPVIRRPSSSHLATTLALTLQFEDAPFRVIVEARMGLEPMMAGLAAQRIGEEALADLRLANAIMADSGVSFDAFLEANRRFHDVIARASGNALFASILQALVGILDGTALGIQYPPSSLAAITTAHHEIYDRLVAGDADGASAAMRDHTAEYLRYVEARYPHLLDRRVTWDMLPL
jgi:GntR family transcriptional regulator, transcriptional repressor for pyruvate dehydrogenase complex